MYEAAKFQMISYIQVVLSWFCNKAFDELYQTCEDIEEEAEGEMNLAGKICLPLGRCC